MSRAAIFNPLLCLLAVAGCDASPAAGPSAARTRTITSVSWDAHHRLVSETRVVPVAAIDPLAVGIGPGGGGGGSGAATQFDMYGFDPVDHEGCASTDFVISDAPLLRASNGTSIMDPSSNLLCLSPPPLTAAATGPETVRLDELSYPKGGAWAGKVQSFRSSLYFGMFLTPATGPATCNGNFHANETSDATACDQTAQVLQFLLQQGEPVNSCSNFGATTCVGNTLETCDPSGQVQAQFCGAMGLSCSPQTLSCCALPVCGAGAVGDSCGATSNSCGSVTCECRYPDVCIEGTCRYFHVPPPPGPIK